MSLRSLTQDPDAHLYTPPEVAFPVHQSYDQEALLTRIEALERQVGTSRRFPPGEMTCRREGATSLTSFPAAGSRWLTR